jgi:peptidoglycan/LPS O-acetylase OafA/YrhL
MQEFKGLTGLRGIAALMVFWAHVKEQLHTYGMNFEIPTVVERLFLSGGRQVDVFFVLSGFVMTLVYRSWFSNSITGASYATFMRRRMARIYPLHAFFLGLLVLVTLLVQVFNIPLRNGLDRFSYDTLLQHLLLIHAWGPLMPAPSTWNPPSWSISIEFLAYLIFPFAMMGLLRAAKASAWPAIVLLSVLGLVANFYLPWEILGGGAIVRGLTEFFLGCAVALVVGGTVSQWFMGYWPSPTPWCRTLDLSSHLHASPFCSVFAEITCPAVCSAANLCTTSARFRTRCTWGTSFSVLSRTDSFRRPGWPSHQAMPWQAAPY